MTWSARVVVGLALFGLVALASGTSEGISTSDRLAVVAADGTLEREFGIESSSRLGVGSYQVITNKNITKCACLATLGSPTSFANITGSISCVQRTGSNGKGFFVKTFSLEGADADRAFMLMAACP